ncbi:GtrA family protein, partial [Methylomonas rivi]
LIGKKVSDTQSGLRGVGRELIPTLISLNGERYEYEINQLILTKSIGVEILEVGIETVYIQNNKSSHFNPLLDSMRIYFLLFRFLLSAILTSIFDLIIFVAIYNVSSSLPASIVIARLCASFLNFALNKKIVFHNTSKTTHVLTLYYLNVLVSGCLAYILIDMFSTSLNLAVVPSKIIVEAMLFIVNFVIQRDFIFKNKRLDAYSD